jgi:hypothetical protein
MYVIFDPFATAGAATTYIRQAKYKMSLFSFEQIITCHCES